MAEINPANNRKGSSSVQNICYPSCLHVASLMTFCRMVIPATDVLH